LIHCVCASTVEPLPYPMGCRNLLPQGAMELAVMTSK
jgi:hypothetical protein